MRYFAFLLVLLMTANAEAFERGDVKSISSGWQVNYTFKSPDGTLGYTNIFVPSNVVKNSDEAKSYADGLAKIKELNWISSLGQ